MSRLLSRVSRSKSFSSEGDLVYDKLSGVIFCMHQREVGHAGVAGDHAHEHALRIRIIDKECVESVREGIEHEAEGCCGVIITGDDGRSVTIIIKRFRVFASIGSARAIDAVVIVASNNSISFNAERNIRDAHVFFLGDGLSEHLLSESRHAVDLSKEVFGDDNIRRGRVA